MFVVFLVLDFMIGTLSSALYLIKMSGARKSSQILLLFLTAFYIFLRISQYSQKTPVLESFFNKVAGQKACNFIKKELQSRCFLVNVAKFLRATFLQNTSSGCFCILHNSDNVLTLLKIVKLHYLAQAACHVSLVFFRLVYTLSN